MTGNKLGGICLKRPKIIKPVLFLLLLTLAAMGIQQSFAISPPEAANFSSNYYYYYSAGGEYTYTITNGEAEIIKYNGNGGSVTIPSNLGGAPVTRIGNRAFYRCTGLTSLTIPNSVTSIGAWAFGYCSGLTSITLPQGLKSIGIEAFANCTGLTSVTIPQGVTYIEYYVFSGCSRLTSISVDINNSAYASKDGVLYNKEGTILIAFPGGLTSVTIPPGVTKIGVGAFADCSGLTSITIPQGVTDIGREAFAYCHGLTSITIPESVTSIGSAAFWFCTNLTGFTVARGVTTIGDQAFGYCNRLTSITIPQGVTNIGVGAFTNCTGLTNITVDTNNTSYASIAGLLLNKGKNILFECPAGLTSVTIPETITAIGSHAFTGCSRLTNITIPPSVASIGYYSFSECTGLTSITIPASVISIDGLAFDNCRRLASIVFDSPTTTIADESTLPSATKIIGFDPSTAKSYAIKYNRKFEALPAKKVSVGAQVGIIKAATESQRATFAVSTQSISNGKAVTITWISSSEIGQVIAPATGSAVSIAASASSSGGSSSNTPPPVPNPPAVIIEIHPAGLTATATPILNNSSTITINAGAASVAGNYYFRATVDGVASGIIKVPVLATETVSSEPIVIGTIPKAISVPPDVTNPSIRVTTIGAANGGQQATLPAVQVSAVTTLGAIEVSIPDFAVITGPAGWNGTINLPTVQANTSVTATPAAGYTNNVQSVIEVGCGDDKLTFNKAVRLLIPGQGGKLAGYSRGGTFSVISKPDGALDTQAWADSNIAAEGDAAIDVGSDLVIWTKHFTKFISYIQTAISGPVSDGGGSGAGPNPVSGTLVSASKGGTISESGATIVIPADAMKNDFRVNVVKFDNIAQLPVLPQSKILGNVLEITKDQGDNFSKPVTITLSFDQSKIDITKYDVGVYWLDNSTDKWTKLDNIIIDTKQSKVSGDVTHFTKFAVIATEKPEKTVIPADTAPIINLNDIAGIWAESNITALVKAGAISGYPDGSFKPDSTITRAEFAVVLVKAFKLEAKNGKVFSDTNNHWAKDYIATANAFGIVNGYSDMAFGPDDPITREQMAAMIVKAAKLEIITSGKSFNDNSQISSWAKSAVTTARERNIISGYPDNRFCPQNNATRAEAVTVVVNALKQPKTIP